MTAPDKIWLLRSPSGRMVDFGEAYGGIEYTRTASILQLAADQRVVSVAQ